MKRQFPIITFLTVFIFLSAGCSNPAQQTTAQANTPQASQQQSIQASSADTGPVDNIEATDGEAVTEVGYLYPACIDGGDAQKWGYINKTGDFAIEPQFDYVYPFKDCGLAAVRTGDFEGVIDNGGKYILQPKYDYISGIYEDAIVAYGPEEGYILFSLQGDKLFVTNGSIGSFDDGFAAYSQQKDESTAVYGYIDKTGKIVIEPAYSMAYSFHGDKALVRLQDNKCAVIDKTGNVLVEMDYNIVGDLSDGTFLYLSGNEKYGYLSEDGSKLTEAVYTNADDFMDGYAVVNISDDYSNPKYGLIDKNGNYVLEPKYGGIASLGQGRYAVSAGTNGNFMDTFSKKAVFTDKGEQITDMAYYEIGRFVNGISSVSTDNQTFLIGLDGRPMEKFVAIEGVGSAESNGDLIEVNVDGDLSYLSMEGQTVWKSERTFRLSNGAVVNKAKYRPDRCMLIQYPVISGLPDKAVQEKLNDLLRTNFVGDNPVSTKEGDSYTDDTGADYGLGQVGGLLVVRHTSWYYQIGAAHGSSGLSAYHLNLGNGKEYSLKDLFKKESDYTGRITGLINKQIEQTKDGEDSYYLTDKVDEIKPDQGFIITDKALQIYYQTYEIAAYAAGQPIFDIGYDEIMDLVDTDGELWKLIADGLDY